jgi:Cytochrome c554 and c-prime
MAPAHELFLLGKLTNLRCSGVRRVGRMLGALAVALASPHPALAQATPAQTPQVTVSLQEKKPATAPACVGDEACNGCHKDKAGSYHQTGHARTSSFPSKLTIKGGFSPGLNLLRTANPDLHFVMSASDSGFSQEAVWRTSPSQVMTRTEQIDVVIGSGLKGQTYLYWDDDKLFQLPVSYWTELESWVNSPGYADGKANFERPVNPRCLECHTSSFQSLLPPVNRYDKAGLVLGIACEKCHGPGGEHVALYRSKSPPRPPAATGIINPAKLPRDRQLDICALCHAGIGESFTPPLSFTAGEVLGHYLKIPPPEPDAPLEVHGGQWLRLTKSLCFKSSPAMTCTTCHDVHVAQRDPEAFAARCLACHQVENCRAFSRLGHRIDLKCVDCHMPLQRTSLTVSNGSGATLRPTVRNHQIGIYPEEKLP